MHSEHVLHIKPLLALSIMHRRLSLLLPRLVFHVNNQANNKKKISETECDIYNNYGHNLMKRVIFFSYANTSPRRGENYVSVCGKWYCARSDFLRHSISLLSVGDVTLISQNGRRIKRHWWRIAKHRDFRPNIEWIEELLSKAFLRKIKGLSFFQRKISMIIAHKEEHWANKSLKTKTYAGAFHWASYYWFWNLKKSKKKF